MIDLDTSFVIDALREARDGRPGTVTRRLEELGEADNGLSATGFR